jgi:FtsP/CotA-like multicopper oxidase with cupredoxin domain
MDGVSGGRMGINGVAMNMEVLNERITIGELERWVIKAQGEHPFHMHGASFLIESLDGGSVPMHERGWKDVVKVNEQAVILIKFDHLANDDTPYMYHCHILEHEDMGMMGQFTVK